MKFGIKKLVSLSGTLEIEKSIAVSFSRFPPFMAHVPYRPFNVSLVLVFLFPIIWLFAQFSVRLTLFVHIFHIHIHTCIKYTHGCYPFMYTYIS